MGLQQLMSEDCVVIKEGKTDIAVPHSSLQNKPPPRTPAFFNPMARDARDVSVVIYRGVVPGLDGDITFADSLAGVGARGLRIAVEVDGVDKVFLNDANPSAMKLASFSARLNQVEEKVVISVEEISRFLITYSTGNERFSIVDVDPFGSPAPFVDLALRSVKDGGILSLTSTDSAVLCGHHSRVSRRRYGGKSLNVDYNKEVGVRLLLGLLATTAGRLDMAITPIFSHVLRHYFRVYVRVEQGAQKADQSIRNMGRLYHCFKCGTRVLTTAEDSGYCRTCGSKCSAAGPLWTSKLFDKAILLEAQKTLPVYVTNRCKVTMEYALQEVDMPATYHDLHAVADKLNVKTPPLSSVIAKLTEMDFLASRTCFEDNAVRTDAPPHVLAEVIRTLG